MSVPKFASGSTNYYEAQLSSQSDSDISVLTISVDSLRINQPIALVKIDTEGHEPFVLAGMQRLIEKHHPIIIVETSSEEAIGMLKSSGYVLEKLLNSPNLLCKPQV